jgi:predicted hydrocarbon binding protein/DNA-binding Lrp family transcriptional regulator
MENIKGTVKILIDETAQKILQLATGKGYYPNQIARELGLSNSLVVMKLKELERLGIIWGRFESKGGKAVKKYYLLKDELILKIDISKGKLSLTEEEPGKIKEIVSKRPELFQDYENYLLWSRGKMHVKDVAEYFNVTLDEAKEILKTVSEDLETAFQVAYEARIKKWKKGVETTFFELVEDSLVIPTHRIETTPSDLSPELTQEISKGETYLSTLKKQYPHLKVEDEVRELEKRKMVVVEEQHVPQLNFTEIRKLTQAKLKKDRGGLFNLGRKTGERMARFAGKTHKGLFEGLFNGADIVKTGGKEKVIIPGCREHLGAKGREKACYFIAGVMEGLLQGKGEEVVVYEETCGARGGKSCEFIISPKEQVEESVSSRRVKRLLLGE